MAVGLQSIAWHRCSNKKDHVDVDVDLVLLEPQHLIEILRMCDVIYTAQHGIFRRTTNSPRRKHAHLASQHLIESLQDSFSDVSLNNRHGSRYATLKAKTSIMVIFRKEKLLLGVLHRFRDIAFGSCPARQDLQT